MTQPEARYTEHTPPSPLRVAHMRAQLRGVAEGLAEAGVPYDLLVDDVREGVARVADRRQRSGR